MQSQLAPCAGLGTLTGPEVLATVPASFVERTATFQATGERLVDSLSPSTAADEAQYLAAHRAAFDTVCFTVAQYASQSRGHRRLQAGDVGHAVRPGGGGGRRRERPPGLPDPLRDRHRAQRGDRPVHAQGQRGHPTAGGQRGVPPARDHLAHAHPVGQGPHGGARRPGPGGERRCAAPAGGAGDDETTVVTVNPRYGKWIPAAAQIAVPTTPAVGDVLNAGANEPTTAPAARPGRPAERVAGPGGRPRVTVVGLGPAGASSVSPGCSPSWAPPPAPCCARGLLRTRRRRGWSSWRPSTPCTSRRRPSTRCTRAIVEALVALATDLAPAPVVYAVPGSPLVAERTVELLRTDPRVDVTIVPSLSFLDLAWDRLGIDPLSAGVHLVDADRYAAPGGRRRRPLPGGPVLVVRVAVRHQALGRRRRPRPARVVLLHHLGLDDEQVLTVPWGEMDRTIAPDHLTSVYLRRGPTRGGELVPLEELVRTLRAECPWDRAQTHATLTPPPGRGGLRGARRHRRPRRRGRPGGRARAAPATGAAAGHRASRPPRRGAGRPALPGVLPRLAGRRGGTLHPGRRGPGVHDKLVARHPHVFGDAEAADAGAVVADWEAIKSGREGPPA